MAAFQILLVFYWTTLYLGSSKRTLKNGYRFVSVGFAKHTLKDLDLLKFLNNTRKLLSLGLLVIENLYHDSFELVSCLHSHCLELLGPRFGFEKCCLIFILMLV